MSATQLSLEDEFGDVVRKRMLGLKLTPEQLSEKSGVPVPQLKEWFAYRGTATPEQARSLATILGLKVEALLASAAASWYPSPTMAPHVTRHAMLPHPSNGYIFDPGDRKHAALIDPAGRPEHLLALLQEGGYDLDTILITHKHDDHCDAAQEIADAFPRARIFMHRLDVHAIGSLSQRATILDDDAEFPFAGDFTIRALHTPGHTDGSVCYLVGDIVFTGDMLFAGSIGGAYGDDTTHDDIRNSIATKLFKLPDSTNVMPGHGPSTTIAQEKNHNPFF